MIQLFELGSVHHQFYAINIKLGESEVIRSLNYHDSSSENLYLISELPEVRLVLTVRIIFNGSFKIQKSKNYSSLKINQKKIEKIVFKIKNSLVFVLEIDFSSFKET